MSISVFKNKDLQSTIIVAAGSILGSFFAYLLQFSLGRMLTIEDYGTFGAFLSLSTILGVLNSIVMVSSVKIISSLVATDSHEKITQFFKVLVKGSSIYGFLLFLGLYLLRFVISDELNISDPRVVTWFALLSGITIFPNISRAFFQGMLKYWGLATYVVYSGFLRFLVPVILVFFGTGLFGVFQGMTIGLGISYLISLVVLGRWFVKPIHRINVSAEVKMLLQLGLPVALTNLGTMGINNIDMLLVKKFFDPMTAGYYAGTVTLGKILLFGAGAVTVVMFPKVSSAHAKSEDYKKVADDLFLIQLVLVVFGVMLFSVFPQFFTQIFFGSRFLNSVEYLPRFSIYIGLYTLLYSLVMYFLAIDKRKVSLILIPVLIAQYIAIQLFHGSIYQVININTIACSVVLIILYFIYNGS